MLEQARNMDQTLLDRRLGESHEQRVREAQAAAKAGSPVWRRITDAADRLGDEAARDLERARGGLSGLGRAGVDIAEKAIELGFDTAVGAMTGGSYRVPHAIRMFGSGAREAHKDGADAEQQMLYAAIKSGREILNNKLTAGLTKIFEQSDVSTIVRYTFNNLTDSATGSKLYKILLKGGEGAVEELVEGVLEPLDKAVYQNITMDLIGIGMGDRPLSAHEARELLAASKKPGYFSKTDIAKLLYNALLGFVIGTMEGGAYITADISR